MPKSLGLTKEEMRDRYGRKMISDPCPGCGAVRLTRPSRVGRKCRTCAGMAPLGPEERGRRIRERQKEYSKRRLVDDPCVRCKTLRRVRPERAGTMCRPCAGESRSFGLTPAEWLNRKREARWSNPEPGRAATRRWRLKNLEKSRESERIRAQAARRDHPEKFREIDRKRRANWTAEHRAARNLKGRLWLANRSPEQLRMDKERGRRRVDPRRGRVQRLEYTAAWRRRVAEKITPADIDLIRTKIAKLTKQKRKSQ